MSSEQGISVHYINPVPVWDVHIPRHMHYALESGEHLEQTLSDYNEKNTSFLEEVSSIDSENFSVITVADELCTPMCLYATDTGVPLYYDEHHLTLTGSSFLARKFQSIMQNLQ